MLSELFLSEQAVSKIAAATNSSPFLIISWFIVVVSGNENSVKYHMKILEIITANRRIFALFG